MRRMKYPNSSRPSQALPASAAEAAAVHDALGRLAHIVAGPGFAQPDSLGWDDIANYALALIHLRESASTAGFERLTQACDALAVPISDLIDKRRCDCRNKLLTLKRFVTHAQAMIPAPALTPAKPVEPRLQASGRPTSMRTPLPSRDRLRTA